MATRASECLADADSCPTIGARLVALAARQPDATALKATGRRSATFADLAGQVESVRVRLASLGIAPGDVVVCAVGARADMAGACATLPCACTFVPVAATLGAVACGELLDRVKPRAVVVSRGGADAMCDAARARRVPLIALDPSDDGHAVGFALKPLDRWVDTATGAALDASIACVMVTSGTTGRPKLVPCRHAQLLLRSRTMSAWLGFGPGDLGAHLVPLHLGHGFRTALLDPLLAGAGVLCLPVGDVSALLASLDATGPTFASAGFTVHREMLARADDLAACRGRHRLRYLRAGSGRLEPREAEAIESLLGVPVLVGYSSTETCVIAHDRLPRTSPRSNAIGDPVACEVAVLADGAVCLEADVTGEILVRGPLVLDRYLDDEALTASAFHEGWFRTGDIGRVHRDGRVEVSGRIKELINRGGEKIAPRDVDRVLEAIPGVRAAASFGVPHPTLGEELVAAVVRDDPSLSEADVLRAAAAGLDPMRVPRRIDFVEALPRTEGGKVLRQALAAAALREAGVAASPAALREAPVAASAASLREAEVAQVWKRFVRVADERADFFLCGGDSLSGARLLAAIEQRFGVALPMRLLFGGAATIRGMADAIDTAQRCATTGDAARVVPPVTARRHKAAPPARGEGTA